MSSFIQRKINYSCKNCLKKFSDDVVWYLIEKKFLENDYVKLAATDVGKATFAS